MDIVALAGPWVFAAAAWACAFYARRRYLTLLRRPVRYIKLTGDGTDGGPAGVIEVEGPLSEDQVRALMAGWGERAGSGEITGRQVQREVARLVGTARRTPH